jgi:asparagine synthase (glutamine-hydrolysing)
MSGIVGLWNLNGRPVERELLQKLCATQAHRGPDGQSHWLDGPVGLGAQMLRVTPESVDESQPAVAAWGPVIVFDGRLDNRDELLGLLKGSADVNETSPDSALVLHAYREFGEHCANRLNGDFALAIFDPAEQKLVLARDALGVRPLYHIMAGKTFLFASEIKALLAYPDVSAQPNCEIIAEYLCMRLLLEEGEGQTFFRGVYSLPPGNVGIVTPQGFKKEVYWDFDPFNQIRLGSSEEYVHEFRRRFDQAVRRRLRSTGPVAVWVSGGLDSSSIFCAAEQMRQAEPGGLPRLRGISDFYDGYPETYEDSYVRDIERQFGVTVTRVGSGTPTIMKDSRKIVWHTEIPLLAWDSVHDGTDETALDRPRTVLTGHWGDQLLTQQAYLIDLFRSLAWTAIWRHIRNYRLWTNDADPWDFSKTFFVDLLRYHVPEKFFPLLRRLRTGPNNGGYYGAAMARLIRQLPHKRTLFHSVLARGAGSAHSAFIYQTFRSRHHVMCMEWNNKIAAMQGVDMAFPFLDRDLVAWVMGIPGAAVMQDGIPKSILRKAMRSVLPLSIVDRRCKADFTAVANSGVLEEYDKLKQHVTDGLAVRLGYFELEATLKELERRKALSYGPSGESTGFFRDLAALEDWLRVFFNVSDLKMISLFIVGSA